MKIYLKKADRGEGRIFRPTHIITIIFFTANLRIIDIAAQTNIRGLMGLGSSPRAAAFYAQFWSIQKSKRVVVFSQKNIYLYLKQLKSTFYKKNMGICNDSKRLNLHFGQKIDKNSYLLLFLESNFKAHNLTWNR